MIGRPPGCLGFTPAEPKLEQVEFFDKDINRPNGIVLADPVFQAFGKQRALCAIRALYETSHPILPRIISRESHQTRRFHTTWVNLDRSIRRARSRHVRFAPKATVADHNVIRHYVPRGDIRIAADFLIRSPRRRGRARTAALRGRAPWRS